MKHYFKKKNESYKDACIYFGVYEDKDITESGFVICDDLVFVHHDFGLDRIRLEDEAGGCFEQDEIESISVEEYSKAVRNIKLAKKLENKFLETIFL